MSQLAERAFSQSNVCNGTAIRIEQQSRLWHTQCTAYATLPERRAPIESAVVAPGIIFLNRHSVESYVGVSDWIEITGKPCFAFDVQPTERQWPSVLALWIPKIYALERGSQSRNASRLIMRFIETKFAEGDLSTVNSFFETIDIDRLSVISISAMFRCSARAKKMLPAWASALNYSKSSLKVKGENVESLFAGLMRS
jgi:hypothetical protein